MLRDEKRSDFSLIRLIGCRDLLFITLRVLRASAVKSSIEVHELVQVQHHQREVFPDVVSGKTVFLLE